MIYDDPFAKMRNDPVARLPTNPTPQGLQMQWVPGMDDPQGQNMGANIGAIGDAFKQRMSRPSAPAIHMPSVNPSITEPPIPAPNIPKFGAPKSGFSGGGEGGGISSL